MGKIHIYYGDGKGKTTAATGLAVRFTGSGKRTVYLQFLKNGTSSEVKVLKDIDNIDFICVKKNYGFTWNMTEQQKIEAKEAYTRLFSSGVKLLGNDSMLVLDELLDVLAEKLINKEYVYRVINDIKDRSEIVITGHIVDKTLFEIADYITYMQKKRHPFDDGLDARLGIEY